MNFACMSHILTHKWWVFPKVFPSAPGWQKRFSLSSGKSPAVGEERLGEGPDFSVSAESAGEIMRLFGPGCVFWDMSVGFNEHYQDIINIIVVQWDHIYIYIYHYGIYVLGYNIMMVINDHLMVINGH